MEADQVVVALEEETCRSESVRRNKEVKVRRVVVLLPLPFQGHLNPTFQLGTLLHSCGLFSITIIHTTFNAPPSHVQQQYPHFRFICISETLPLQGQGASPDNLVSFIQVLNDAITIPLTGKLEMLMREFEEAAASAADIHHQLPPLLISDAIMYKAGEAAQQAGMPRLVFRTGSATCFHVFSIFPMLWEKGYLSCEQSGDAAVPELPPFRVRDLPSFEACSPRSTYQVVTQCVEQTRAAKALIINTFESLESKGLARLREDPYVPPVFPIGPLHKFSPDTESSLLMQDRSCIDWLDKMAPGSVLYVSFGSLACLSEQELLETAWGLANSCQPFLWVLRPGMIKGGGAEPLKLPDSFLEEIRERGRVLEWAPQQEVLQHPSVGGFWTHSGWNSTLESICEGVPMLCWPYFGDQMVNSRVSDQVWKVGIQLEKVLKRDAIERAVRRLMVEADGVEMRKRAMLLKAEAHLCTAQGGSSYGHLDRLVHFLSSLK